MAVGTLHVVRTRDYCHGLNNWPWDYGPQNKIEPAALEQALIRGLLQRGVICGPLAKLFHWKVVTEYAVPARFVTLTCPKEGHLSHAVAEVQVGGKWELHDPYFNCCFTIDGDYVLSVEGVRKCLREGKKIETRFHHCSVNWMAAWLAYQKSLLWLAEQILAAQDYNFRPMERKFWEYLLPWLQTGTPTDKFGWKERQYSYWDYFGPVGSQDAT